MPPPLALNPARPRKTPVQLRSTATFEAVLRAAAHILTHQGLSAFNTNAVAEKAGISIGSLYQYFPSKDAILVALIERENALFAEEMIRVAAGLSEASLAEHFGAMLRFGHAHHLERMPMTDILAVEERRLARHLDCDAVWEPVLAAVETVLAGRPTEIGPDERPLAARELMVMAKALMEHAGERCAEDWDRVIDRAVRAMVAYVGSPEAGARR